jgi:molecular chaperone DnaK
VERGVFEELVADLIERSIEPCKIAIKDAGITAPQINQVLLVGGMTRMPKVQQKVKEFFGKEPHKGINPDEVVAVGAAIQVGVLKGEVKDVLLLDVTPLSLGVETAGGVFTKIIEKNTTIPCKKGQVFSTAVDNQPLVSVHVLQGEREMAADNKTLARFELVGIPPAPRGVPQIEVSFDIDANGIVHVGAKDLGTGKVQQVRVVSNSGLSEQEIQGMISDAQAHAVDDKKKKELAELRNNADGLIYTTEKSLEEYGNLLTEKDREEIKADLENLKGVLNSGDPGALKEAFQRLEGSAYRIADAIYAGEAKSGS